MPWASDYNSTMSAQQRNTPRGWQITLNNNGNVVLSKSATPGSSATVGTTTLNVTLDDARELVLHLLNVVT
jgi:hypothetical protein